MLTYNQPKGNKERKVRAMKKELWIDISITDFGNGTIEGCYCECIGDGEIEMKTIPLDKAKRLIWELVLAGGVRHVRINQFDRHIVTAEAYIFLPI